MYEQDTRIPSGSVDSILRFQGGDQTQNQEVDPDFIEQVQASYLIYQMKGQIDDSIVQWHEEFLRYNGYIE